MNTVVELGWSNTVLVTDVDVSSDDEKPVVAVDTLLTQAEVKVMFECQEVTSNGYTYPRSDFPSSFSDFIPLNFLLCYHRLSHLPRDFQALNCLMCAVLPLRNYSLTHLPRKGILCIVPCGLGEL